MRWISVKDGLPGNGNYVLLCCETLGKNKYVCDGYFAERWGIEVAAYYYGDCATEYNEEQDAYYLEAGWYEVVQNWDDYSSVFINDQVTHWMPLPEPPKED